MNKFMNFAANVQAAFNNDINDYAAFSQLMVETARGTQSVSKEEANAKIVEIFHNVLGITKESRPGEVRKAIRRNQALVFDILEETLDSLLVSDWNKDPFMMKYVDQRNLALGDKNEFYVEDDSILSVMRVAGNHHDIIRQRLGAGTSKSLETFWCAIKVYAEFERVLTGAEDFGKFITKVYDAYDRYIKDAIYKTFIDYSKAIPAMYKKTGNVTAENLNAICDLVSTAMGAPVTIMGTRTALAKVTALQNATYISDAMKDEHYRNGTLGFWEGKELIEIPQIFEKGKVGTYKLDNNMIWIMPNNVDKFIKFVNEGDTQLKSVMDKDVNMDMTYDYEFQTKLGFGIITSTCFGVYDIVG